MFETAKITVVLKENTLSFQKPTKETMSGAILILKKKTEILETLP
tara:strand:- start:134 stop:268 length:135 start_codon:yes stop_codon:yes gene_type:complete